MCPHTAGSLSCSERKSLKHEHCCYLEFVFCVTHMTDDALSIHTATVNLWQGRKDKEKKRGRIITAGVDWFVFPRRVAHPATLHPMTSRRQQGATAACGTCFLASKSLSSMLQGAFHLTDFFFQSQSYLKTNLTMTLWQCQYVIRIKKGNVYIQFTVWNKRQIWSLACRTPWENSQEQLLSSWKHRE